MSRIKLDSDIIGLSSLMEKRTHVHVKDCFRDEETIFFIVGVGELGKAIGKGGSTIKKVQEEFGKKIRVVEFRSEAADFIKNLIYPLKVEDIIVGNEIVIKDSNRKTKSLLIGRDGKNLALVNRAVQRFFGKEVKVE
jgi:transcription termination/antitermination protein NusA